MTPHTLTVRSTNPASGVNITSSSDRGGRTLYRRTLDQGTRVTLTAPLHVGSGANRKTFDRWSGASTSTNRTITLRMNGNRAVTANYSTPAFNFSPPVNNRVSIGNSRFIPNRYLPPSTNLPNGLRDAHLANDYTSSTNDLRILAFADGKVVNDPSIPVGGAYMLVLEHTINGEMIYSMYLHLAANSSRVSRNQTVVAGQHIATMGSTGAGTGVHLHFAIANANRWPDMRGHQMTEDYREGEEAEVDFVIFPNNGVKYYNPERVLNSNGRFVF